MAVLVALAMGIRGSKLHQRQRQITLKTVRKGAIVDLTTKVKYCTSGLYRVIHMLVELGWFDLDL